VCFTWLLLLLLLLLCRNCRASLSRRKVQPHDFLSSNSKLRKHNSDQCSKQQKSNKQKSCATSEAAAATDDDTLQGFDSGFEAATAACAATAYAGVDMCFAEQPGAYLQAEACNNGMTFDYVYSQIQQQQQQQLQLEQQLHSAMTTCADTCTADFQTFTAAMQPAGVEGSSSASPVGLQADLFGRIDSVCSVSGGAADAMQAHVESVMMAELMAELSKAQQEQQQQQMQHVGFTQLAADEPCDASSRTLPTLPVLAQPNPEQQQQALLAQQVLQQQQQQQQAMLTQQALQQQLSQTLVTHSSLQPQQQQTLMTQSNLQQQLLLHKLQQSTLLAVNHQPQLFCQSHCHSSSCRGCMAAGCAATAVPAANITMSGIRTAAGVNCLDGSGTSVAAAAAAARAAAAASLPAAAVALPVGLAGTSTLVVSRLSRLALLALGILYQQQECTTHAVENVPAQVLSC
jgi:hypothetical protein